MKPFATTRLALILLIASLVGVRSALADVVHLKSGRTLEGRIVLDSARVVKVQTRLGTVEIPRSDILRIEKKQTPREVYEEKRADLGKNDIAGMFELAMYCKENKLSKQHRQLLRDIIKLSPQHDGANRELGKIKYDGQWFTKKELEKYKDQVRIEMEGQGLVLESGKWMTPDEAMVARGYVMVDGEWLEKEVAERRKAELEFQQVFGVPLTITDTEYVSIRGTRPGVDNEFLHQACEDAFQHFFKLAKPTEQEMKFFTKYKLHIYILDDPTLIRTFIESGFIDRYHLPKKNGVSVKERYLDQSNFSIYFPWPLIMLSEGRHLKAGGSRETALAGMTMVHLGNVLIRRLKRGGGLPSWAEAGMAHYIEGEFNGFLTVSIIEYPHYEPAVNKWIDGWETFAAWEENLRNPRVTATLPSLRSMMETPIEELRADALAKSWSIVSFLLEHHREPFFQLIRRSKMMWKGERITSQRAFDEAFGPLTVDQIEADWEKWLKKQRPIAPSLKTRSGLLGGDR